MAEIDRLHGADALEAFFRSPVQAVQEKLRAEGWEKGVDMALTGLLAGGLAERPEPVRQQTMEQGLSRCQYLLVRQATLRFDAETVERLPALLDEIRDFAHLVEAACWVINSASGDDLIARVGDITERDRQNKPIEFETQITTRALAERERLRAEGFDMGFAKVLAERWAERPEPVRELTIELGLSRGRYLLVRQATLKFDAETTERLRALLEEIRDFPHLVEAACWVIDSATGDEMIFGVDKYVRSGS